jgi:peptide/nickel transport system substrate-binding protein
MNTRHSSGAPSQDAGHGGKALGAIALACALLFSAGSSLAEEPKRGGTLAIGLAQDPLMVDPIRTGTFTERQFSTPVYEALFDIAPDGSTVPFLAEKYSVSNDQKTYTLTLRPGIKFHDGTPMNAEAVLANFERTRNPENRCRCLNSLEDIADVRAVDELTVEITLSRPNAALPTALADAGGIMVSPTAFRADPTAINTNPVGTGPFKFVEWVRGSRFVVEKNPDYWQPGLPYLDKIIMRGMQNTVTLEATFQSGQIDIIMQPSFRFVAQMKNNKSVNVLSPAGFGTEGIYMNLTQPPLDDVRVRHAVAHAMNRELLQKTLAYGVPTLAYSPFGPGMDVDQPVEIYPKYDLEKAKALVSEYGKPVQFTLQFNNSPLTNQFAQSLQEMWSKAGIKVDLEPLDQNRLVQNMVSGQYAGALFRYTGRADPHSNAYSFLHSKYADVKPSQNYGGIKSPKIDELLERGMATIDPKERKQIYSELAKEVVSVLPNAYTYNVTDSIVTNKKVHGITVIPDGLIRFDKVWRD